MPRLNRAILDKIVALSREAVLVADVRRQGTPILFANPAFAALAEVELDSVAGRDWAFFLNQVGAADELRELGDQVVGGTACQAELDGAREGTRFQLKLLPLPGRQGKAGHLLVQVSEAASPEPAAAELKVALLERELDLAREANDKLARRDPDSGLLRYSYFLELSQRDFALCSRQRRELAVLTFTVREFDVYRETFGDEAARSCLRMVGGRIAGALRRASDLCARLDDASFVALVTGQNQEQVEAFAEEIAEQVRRLALHHPRAHGERCVTCAVGVNVSVPDGADCAESFVLAARGTHVDAAYVGLPAA
jgi:diguanylate cyclase (GGDEF)-like protein